MGSEYQRDNETVISFANRIRDLGRRIIETQRVNTGNIDAIFRTSIENNSVECFKRGLKPEIEQRLENAADMVHIVQNAIKRERLVDARKALRQEGKGKFENKEFRRGTYLSQFHNSREMGENSRTTNTHSPVICHYCSKPDHLANRCRQRISEINYVQVNCQLCNKEGHSASQCRNLSRCQLCEKQGHVAKQCHFQSNTCQICNKAGHVASRCFQSNSAANRTTTQLEARSQLTCQICSRVGHTAATCRIKMDKSCAYCKNNGHTIEDCHKRQYNERIRPGNEKGLPNTSAGTETSQRQVRSTNLLQTEDPICELLPLD